MLIANKGQDVELLALIPEIRGRVDEWAVITVRRMAGSSLTAQEIIKTLSEQYAGHKGIIFNVSDDKVVLLTHLARDDDFSAIKFGIESKLPQHSCRVILRKMSEIGLKQIQIDLKNKEGCGWSDEDFYMQREIREENVVLLADDDAFVRKAMKSVLSPLATVIEVDNGEGVVDAYRKCNPDVAFLCSAP